MCVCVCMYMDPIYMRSEGGFFLPAAKPDLHVCVFRLHEQAAMYIVSQPIRAWVGLALRNSL